MAAVTSWGPVVWMAVPVLVVWLGVAAATAGRYEPEALLGMAAPLVVAGASWLAMRRAYAGGPERLMAVIMRLFALKMVLFGAYVTVLLAAFDLRPLPFVASFAGCFIALYAMEALFLKRLLSTTGARPQRRAELE